MNTDFELVSACFSTPKHLWKMPGACFESDYTSWTIIRVVGLGCPGHLASSFERVCIEVISIGGRRFQQASSHPVDFEQSSDWSFENPGRRVILWPCSSRFLCPRIKKLFWCGLQILHGPPEQLQRLQSFKRR